MLQNNTTFENFAGPLAIAAILNSGTWVWARLDNEQLENWLTTSGFRSSPKIRTVPDARGRATNSSWNAPCATAMI